MTTTIKRPRLPFTKLPVAWGRQAHMRATYDHLVRDYRTCQDDEVVFVLLSMTGLVSNAPQSTQAEQARFYATLRRWNASLQNQKTLLCPRCGEFRLHQLIAESVRIHLLHVVEILAEEPAVPLLQPCEQPPLVGVRFCCRSCGSVWQREEAATIALDASHLPGMHSMPFVEPEVDPQDLN